MEENKNISEANAGEEEKPVPLPTAPEQTSDKAKTQSDKPSKSKESMKTRGGRVMTYLAILFAVAFLLMLLSYLVSQRNNTIALGELSSNHAQATADAFENIQLLQDDVTRLEKETEEQKDEIKTLTDRVEELKKENSQLTEQTGALTEWAEKNEKAVEILLSLVRADGAGDKSAAKAAIVKANSMGEDFEASLTESQKTTYETISKKYK